jgi:hypothetical protein
MKDKSKHKTMNENIKKAGSYIFQHGCLSKWGTGANAVSTEVAIRQQEFIIKEFALTWNTFSEAMRCAELLDRQESEAEVAFFKSHPELNP